MLYRSPLSLVMLPRGPMSHTAQPPPLPTARFCGSPRHIMRPTAAAVAAAGPECCLRARSCGRCRRCLPLALGAAGAGDAEAAAAHSPARFVEEARIVRMPESCVLLLEISALLRVGHLPQGSQPRHYHDPSWRQGYLSSKLTATTAHPWFLRWTEHLKGRCGNSWADVGPIMQSCLLGVVRDAANALQSHDNALCT